MYDLKINEINDLCDKGVLSELKGNSRKALRLYKRAYNIAFSLGEKIEIDRIFRDIKRLKCLNIPSGAKFINSNSKEESKEHIQYINGPEILPTKSLNLESESLEKTFEIPEFLFKRLSKKAQKLLGISIKSLEQFDFRQLQDFIDNLSADKLRFNPSYKDEKEIINLIEQKIKILERAIKIIISNQLIHFINEIIIKPMKVGYYDAILNEYSKTKDDKKSAQNLFNLIDKRFLKNQNFTKEILLSEIEKLLKKRFLPTSNESII